MGHTHLSVASKLKLGCMRCVDSVFRAFFMFSKFAKSGASSSATGTANDLIPWTLFPKALVESVQAKIDASKTKGERVTTYEDIKQELLQHEGLCRERVQIEPDLVGVHQANRPFYGLSSQNCHTHGDEIIEIGFRWAKCADATVIEAPPPPLNREALECNSEAVSLSAGTLPPLTDLKALSLGSGHTNGFCRAVKGNCRTSIARLMDAQGKLNIDVLCATRPTLREACKKGLRWTLFHWACSFVWPGFIDLVISSLNLEAKHDKSELEVLLEMHALKKQALSMGKEPNYEEIELVVLQTLPACAPYIKALSAVLRRLTAEQPGELKSYDMMFGCSGKGKAKGKRNLGAEFLGKLSTLKYKVSEKFPYVETACIMANWSSPKVVDGVCRLIPASMLVQLTSKDNLEKIQAAENLMDNMRALCDQLRVEESIRVKTASVSSVRCILHIFKTWRQRVENSRT